MHFSLPYIYNFDRALDRLSLDPLHAVNLSDKSVKVPMAAGNIVTVKALGTTEKPVFAIEGAKGGQDTEIKELFHFHKSLEPINAHFEATNLAELFEEHRGTPLIREFSLYGSLMKSIIHQQLNLSFAHTLTSRFVQKYGEEREGVWFYPEPNTIARIDVNELRELQFSTRKAEYVIGLSQAIAEGTLDIEGMKAKKDEEIAAELITYRGVGPWTAQNFLLFGLGRPNLFPLADIGLQNALKLQWQLPEKPRAEEIIRHLPDWSPYLSYAALYLWRSLE
ncbi:DNA-3-methyladenine glycosylase [Planococcus sp. N028]|uniref:DNA-3-methyladenine glycosylase II n=1 Tax=Planococcus shixiaomingii TaxID=3058393 RepID=A0ABT8N1A2_9BACL|nr:MULTISPECIES: DNA-3-methyladenine glycosylase [unclassified Planococcus (in: firmicutes)]MDN7241447.1 DNA-3-methyladenine glycosylase [Planococcus sp. N028]WKA53701.1 DNA-3-methyladenine glycosylase [Planococcus sp. N022]